MHQSTHPNPSTHALQSVGEAVTAFLEFADAELVENAALTPEEFDELENQLAIRAACLGWTGNPMRQPLATVAAIVRSILSRRR